MPSPRPLSDIQPVETSGQSPVALSIQRRREEEKEQRRNSILDAAEQIIAEKSWAETNFSEIAKLTRLSRSLIYVYFPTRHELHHALCNRSAAVLRPLFAQALSSGNSGLQQVEAIARAYHRFAIHFPVYFKLHAEREADSGDGTPSQPYIHPAFVLFEQALSRGIADGSIKQQTGDRKATAVSLWAFTHGLLLVTSRKAEFLESRMEISPDKVIEHGFSLLREMLAA